MSSKKPKRLKTSACTKLVIGAAVLFVVGYGFYIETRDFHPKAKFGTHRKFGERTVERNNQAIHQEQQLAKPIDNAAQANLQRESEQLQSSGSKTEGATQVKSIQESNPVKISIVDSSPPPPQADSKSTDAASKATEKEEVQQDTSVENETQASGNLQTMVDDAEAALAKPIVRQARVADAAKLKGMAGLSKWPTLDEWKQNRSETAIRKVWGRIESGAGIAEVDDLLWKERQEAVRLAAKESWSVYEQYAMGADELAPLTLKGKQSVNFEGLEGTLIDSLDTLWMMGLKDEFQRARAWLAQNLDFNKRSKISLFETTIRIIGGMLSAYDLSGDRVFLTKSLELADKLMPSLNTTKSGIPTNLVQFNAAPGEFKKSEVGRAALAEFGSIQMEFLALSQRSSDPSYGEKAEALIKTLHENYPDKGLLPVWFNRKQAKYTGTQLYTVGAMADSFFEYLLKLWLQHQKQVEMYRSMWELAIDEILDQLVAVSKSGLTFLGQRRNRGMFSGKMEHLACYLPGNIALGVVEGAVTGDKAAFYMDVAANLTFTCYQLYNRTQTGLGLDVVMFSEGAEMLPKISKNVLRPETVESLFYMWRVTGEIKYREWGWAIFQAFQRYSRTPEGAFASVKNVNVVPVEQEDSMESFWIAETLKYLWLLFGPDNLFSFSEWVLNTEAHPFRISLS